jgi:D-tyrosyl-tRNA(Tyr) deacylase
MVEQETVGAIGHGLLALLGVAAGDTTADAEWLLGKVLELRIFENGEGRFDRSLKDVGGELLVVSQFTLFADVRKGRRPSFGDAAPPDQALALYEHFAAHARRLGVSTATGRFGASMQVELINDGPVTIVIDTKDR